MSVSEHVANNLGKYGIGAIVTSVVLAIGGGIYYVSSNRDNLQNSPRNIATQVNSLPISSSSQEINPARITLQELVINEKGYVVTPVPEGYVASIEGRELPIEKGRFSFKETKDITINFEPGKTPSIIESQFTEQYVLVRASKDNNNRWNIDPNTKHGDLVSVVNSRLTNTTSDSTGKHSQKSNYDIPEANLPIVRIGSENYFLIECITPDHPKDLDIILMPVGQTAISHRLRKNAEGTSFTSDVLKGPAYMANLANIGLPLPPPKKEEKKEDSRPIKPESIENALLNDRSDLKEVKRTIEFFDYKEGLLGNKIANPKRVSEAMNRMHKEATIPPARF